MAQMRARSIVAATLIVGFCSCQNSLQPIIPAGPSRTPEPAGQQDAAFSVAGVHDWYLIGGTLAASSGGVACTVAAPAGVRGVCAFIDGQDPCTLDTDGSLFTGLVDISGLGPGEHQIRFAVDGSDSAIAWRTFRRSFPLYVFVSNDWESADNSWLGNSDSSLTRQEELHRRHPGLLLTHLLGPYTFTSPTVTPERRAFIVEWHRMMTRTYGDEVGMHFHARCDFVSATGIECLHETTYDGTVDTTGYSVCLFNYPEDTFRHFIAVAESLFVSWGLDKPVSFRAGGWVAALYHLRVLSDAGFRVDASACNWRRMPEPPDSIDSVLYRWLAQRWPDIHDTSQPYYPETDPGARILEVPDNGLLVDQMTTQDMLEVFRANWDGGVLTSPRQVSFGFHPQSFREHYFVRLDSVLTHVDKFLAVKGTGPVVYATLGKMAEVW